MNTHKLFNCIRSLVLVAVLLMSNALVAQVAFRKGALYNLFPATDGKLVLQLDGNKAAFQKMDAAVEGQYWTVTDLSGSIRIINPFTNQALRADGDKVGVGENNGSDEAQLWKIVETPSIEGRRGMKASVATTGDSAPQRSAAEQQEGGSLLVPANRPEVAMCGAPNVTISAMLLKL